jgi:hypothetical protein
MQSDPAKTSPVWLLFLALLGLVYVQGGSAPPPTETSGGRAKTVGGRGANPTREPELRDVSIEVHDLLTSGGFTPRVLIALVPDPEPGATQVGWMFDSYADALQRAVQGAGYLLFRRALPLSWTGTSEKGTGATPTEDGARLAAHEPGLLVFRSQAEEQLLLVFLVGESPTRGVEPGEFSRVFDWLCYLQPGWAREPFNAELAVLGPAFSGAAWSLARAIVALGSTDARVGRTDLRFRVISGTATGPGVKKILETDPRVSFSATVIPDTEVIRALYDYVQRSHVPLSKVALLVESTTGYGDAVFKGTYHEPGKEHGGRPGEREAPRIAFQFPPHVAQTRVAYEQDRPAREQPAAGSSESRISKIELSLDDPTRPGDVVPPLNSRMTSVSVDLVLASILGTMAREDVRYVAIVATDPRDKLFLARKLHEYLPDVRVLTTESNLLYAHPDYLRYLDGTIIATTYPLFSKSQLWVVPERAMDYLQQPGSSRTTRVIQFADAGAEGVYNATLALLGDGDLMKDYGMPRFGGQRLDEFARRHPPIWITAVGRGGMWPLAIERGYDTNQVLPGGLSDSPDPPVHDLAAHVSYSRSGLSLLVVIGLIVAAHALLVLRHWRPGAAGNGSAWRVIEPLRPLKDPGDRRAQRVWLLGLLVTLLTVELMFLGLLVVFLGCAWDGHRLVDEASAVAIGAAIAVLVPLVLLIGAFVRAGGRVAGPILGFAAAAAAGWCTWAILASGPSTDSVFLYLRATNPGSGLSLAVPLLLTGTVVYLWCLHHLRRLYFCEALDVRNPLAEKDVPCSEPLAQTETEIRRIERDTVVSAVPWYISGPTFIVALLPCTALWRSLLPGFDGAWFDRLFLATFTLAYFAVLSSCLRFVWLWVNLRTLLRQLDHHPLTAAFGRLPKSLRVTLRHQFYRYVPGPSDRFRWTKLWLRLGGVFTDFFTRERATELSPPLPDADREALSVADSAAVFDAESTEQAAAGRELTGAESAAQRALTTRAAEVARLVMPTTPGFEVARRDAPASLTKLLDRAESFVAIQVVTSLGPKFVQLGNLLEFAVVGMLLITFAFASYPFQPQQLLVAFSLTLAATVVLVLLIAIVQADRDPLLSAIGGTSPGRITFDRGFISRVVMYGVMPVLTVIATQFPAAGQVFDSLFKLVK